MGQTLAELGVAALVVSNPKDVGYLTGFLGSDSYLLVTAWGHQAPQPVLISDFRYKEEIEDLKPPARVFIRSRSMHEAIAEVLSAIGVFASGEDGKKIAIQAEHMSVAEKSSLGRKLSAAGGPKKLTDSVNLVPKQRLIKDDAEIALLKKAAKIQQDALLAVLPTIKAGQTEADVAARLEFEMKTRGSEKPGFETIVASGAKSSLPHYRPENRKIAAGKPLLIDWGAVYQGYHADMTRTFSLGKWSPKFAEVYKVVQEAQVLAAAALAPGKTATQIDLIARKHIIAAGFGDFFGHGLGHGVGLSGHEDPRLTNVPGAGGSVKLEAGMVVTIEPGIYIPGEGGVRLEDVYLITEDDNQKGGGSLCLCSMKKDLDWAVL